MLVPAEEEHIWHLGHNMHPDDIAEVWAASGHTPMQALIQGVKHSPHPLAWVENGIPYCILGVTQGTLLNAEYVGHPWLLAHKNAYKKGKTWLKWSRKVSDIWIEDYDYLYNYVDERHKRAQRWLKWMGYTLEEPEIWGAEGLPFRKFWRRKECALQQSSQS